MPGVTESRRCVAPCPAALSITEAEMKRTRGILGRVILRRVGVYEPQVRYPHPRMVVCSHREQHQYADPRVGPHAYGHQGSYAVWAMHLSALQCVFR